MSAQDILDSILRLINISIQELEQVIKNPIKPDNLQQLVDDWQFRVHYFDTKVEYIKKFMDPSVVSDGLLDDLKAFQQQALLSYAAYSNFLKSPQGGAVNEPPAETPSSCAPYHRKSC